MRLVAAALLVGYHAYGARHGARHGRTHRLRDMLPARRRGQAPEGHSTAKMVELVRDAEAAIQHGSGFRSLLRNTPQSFRDAFRSVAGVFAPGDSRVGDQTWTNNTVIISVSDGKNNLFAQNFDCSMRRLGYK